MKKDLDGTVLEKLGIREGWEIVLPDEPDLVEKTAGAVLQALFRKASIHLQVVKESCAKADRRILLGRLGNCSAVRQLSDKGEIAVADISPEDDGFHLRQIGKDIVIAGANPRGVLFGAYALEDFIRAGAEGILDIREIPYFRKRINAQGYYFNASVNLKTDEFTEEKAQYLSRLKVNQYLSDDNTSYILNLRQFTSSEIFPFVKPPDPDFIRKVKTIAAICKKYGIEYYQWICEPMVIADEDAGLFPPEALGRVRRPHGGSPRGWNWALCVNSPVVQAYLREMMKKFVCEFEDIKGFFFYNLDFNGWLCTPELCERCSKTVKDSPHDKYNPWESQALLVSLLARAAHEARPDFAFIYWAAVHFNGQDAEKLLRNATGYDALASTWMASDRDIIITGVPVDEYLMTQRAALDRGVPLYMMYECCRLECIQPGFPYPFHVSDALRKFKKWDARNLLEFGGPDPAHNSINALAMKAFQTDPDLDPEAVLSSLASRQFGTESGALMYKAWEEIRDAMDIWREYNIHPFSGSQPYIGIGSLLGVPESILPGIEKYFEWNLEIRTVVEPWRAPDYQRFREKPFLEDYERMGVHLKKAAELAEQAVARADGNKSIDLCYYPGSVESLGRPTCREYAELNHAAIAISDLLCRQRIHIIRAVHLLKEKEVLERTDDKLDLSENKDRYLDLVREDIVLQEQFIDMMTGFYEQRPCLSRAGITREEIGDLIADTDDKIKKLKKYLNEG